jgi:hypothetical protein
MSRGCSRIASALAVLAFLVALALPTHAASFTSSSLAGGAAYGPVPALLPARLLVGLKEGPGETWMANSGVAWDMRYQYFTLGWRNNWGYDPTNSGQWGLDYMNECDRGHFLPVIEYYCMNDEPGGGEAQFYSKTQNVTTMSSYFSDFNVLMQRCKDFGKPVLVLMEGDGFGYMEIQSGDNPNAPSAVASTGMPELQGLPNTAAGWGLAFLAIRKAVGATKVVLGMDISGWATQKDILYFSVTDSLQPEVDKAYAFDSKLGLASNVTGQTFDVLAQDPLDRDSDYYRLVVGEDRWWDASDAASISSKSFNRYADWLRRWNVKAQKRWMLWQVPVGNSNQLNVANTGQARGGYKDNRPEYFFLAVDAHLRKFADVGVIGMLFGAGADGQSMFQNDYYADGQLFLKSRAGAFLNVGGLPIVTGAAVGVGEPMQSAVPLKASLSPNPVRSESALSFVTTKPGDLRVTLYDLSGRRVSEVLAQPGAPAGEHRVTLRARGDRGELLPSGVYLLRIAAAEGEASSRVVIAR